MNKPLSLEERRGRPRSDRAAAARDNKGCSGDNAPRRVKPRSVGGRCHAPKKLRHSLSVEPRHFRDLRMAGVAIARSCAGRRATERLRLTGAVTHSSK